MPLSGRTLPVSSELRWLLDHWQSDGRWPVPEAPRPTSAIVLIRDSADGLELFITRQLDARGVEDRNRWAFPTSSLRPGDVRKLPLAGWNSARCARALSIENNSRALHHFSAAARITFAATGILLAEDVDREIVAAPQTDWRTTRSRLFSNEVAWSQVLGDRDLRLRPDLCKPWLRWINTPTQLHRFDTTLLYRHRSALRPGRRLPVTERDLRRKRPGQVLAEVGRGPRLHARPPASSSKASPRFRPWARPWRRSATSTRCVRRSSTTTVIGRSSSTRARTPTARAAYATGPWPSARPTTTRTRFSVLQR